MGTRLNRHVSIDSRSHRGDDTDVLTLSPSGIIGVLGLATVEQPSEWPSP
ncbi:hypothetical protein [Streptosporangium sp. NPDC049644]